MAQNIPSGTITFDPALPLSAGLKGAYVCRDWNEMRTDKVGDSGYAPGYGDTGTPEFASTAIGSVHSPLDDYKQAHTVADIAWIPAASGLSVVWYGNVTSASSPGDVNMAGLFKGGSANGEGSQNFGLRTVGNNCFGLLINDSQAFQDQPLTTGTFAMVATVTTGGLATLYKDGAQINQGALSYPTFAANNNVLIGARRGRNGGCPFQTALALFYNRVLSPTEAAQISAYPFAPFGFGPATPPPSTVRKPLVFIT